MLCLICPDCYEERFFFFNSILSTLNLFIRRTSYGITIAYNINMLLYVIAIILF